MGACRDSGAGPVIAALGDLPPYVSDLVITPNNVVPGEAFTVSYKVVAARGIAYSEVIYVPTLTANFVQHNDAHGAFSVSEVTAVPAMERPPGSVISNIAVVAVDLDGRVGGVVGAGFSAVGTVKGSIAGPVPPTCQTIFDFEPCGWTVVVVGDTLSLKVTAESPQDLAWIGYRIGPPFNTGDSAAVRGTEVSKTFAVPITSQWMPDDQSPQAGLPEITYFTRDLFDHRPTYTQIGGPFLIHGPRHSFTVARMPPGHVWDTMLDTLRGMLYLSQPDSGRVLRLALATMTFAAPITLSGKPWALDLSLSGDSLLVGLFGTQELGIVNLQTGAVSRLPIAGLPTNLGTVGPWFVREAANRKVLISISSTQPATYRQGQVWEYDLNTGQQGRRLEAGEYGGPIVPIGDRSHLVVGSHIYTAATDVMTTSLANDLFGDVSSDAAGQYILTGNQLWRSDFTPVRDVAQRLWSNDFDATVISSDGLYVFITTPFGYRKVRVSDDRVTEDVPVRLFPDGNRIFGEFIMLPGGETLIGIGASEIARIDLRPLSLAPRR